MLGWLKNASLIEWLANLIASPNLAAASSASKLIYDKAGGFTAAHTANVMISQIQLTFKASGEAAYSSALAQATEAVSLLEAAREEIIQEANKYCENMVKRGGGVKDIEIHLRLPRRHGPSAVNALSYFAGSNHPLSPDLAPGGNPSVSTPVTGYPFVVLHLLVDVCDAMGANLVNTIAEGVSGFVASKCRREIETSEDSKTDAVSVEPVVGLRILSNLCLHRMVKSSFRLPVESLAWKGVEGIEVAKRVLNAWEFARDDSYRACTHNKGAMNGVDAVALATGQDTRAVEASVHAFASVGGVYQPVTRYAIVEDEPTADTSATSDSLDSSTTSPESVSAPSRQQQYLEGTMEVPLAVGTKGGSLGAHPIFKWTLALLGNPDSATLAEIMASVGLAQNFAAMRALAIEGIQKGHMALHARKEAACVPVPGSKM